MNKHNVNPLLFGHPLHHRRATLIGEDQKIRIRPSVSPSDPYQPGLFLTGDLKVNPKLKKSSKKGNKDIIGYEYRIIEESASDSDSPPREWMDGAPKDCKFVPTDECEAEEEGKRWFHGRNYL